MTAAAVGVRLAPRDGAVLRRVACLVVCSILLALGSCASARAATFGVGIGSESAGEINEGRGVAIDEETGEVFVVDQLNNRIDVFDRSGAFLRAFGWGVANRTEQLQTCTSTCFTGFSGSGAGELSFAEGVAVDNDALSPSHGDVYVFETGNARVQKFTPDGEFALMFGGEVNATTKGDVCLAEEACKAGVAGTSLGRFQPPGGLAIATGANGAVLVGDQSRVQQFNASGSLEGVTSLPGAGAIKQLAVDSANDLYVVATGSAGVHKYDLTGKELGSARDAAGAPGSLAATGETLFVADSGAGGHILQFAGGGEQQRSFGAGVSAFNGIAYGQIEDAVYALGKQAGTIVPVPSPGPLVVSQAASAVQPTGATLDAVVNPEGPQATSYRFEYGPTSAYGASTPTVPLSGKPFEDQSASATLAGLQSASTYHFRVVVTNAGAETSVGPDETFTTPPPVAVDGESVVAVTAFTAQLQAQLNPHGAATAYHFEYGPTAAYGSVAPTPDASAGEGVEAATVTEPIQGLSPDTTYHYRVVAQNQFGESRGADQTFTTQGATSAALIDGRAWEMVSPLEKQGATFEAIAKEGALIEAAEDGDAITYAAKAPVTKQPEGNRSIANSQVLSTRTAPGAWATREIATRHETVAGLAPGEPSEYRLFSPDLETGLVEPRGATPLSPEASERTPYRREADGSFTPLVTAANVAPGVKFGGTESSVGAFAFSPRLITATPDQSDVLLSSPQPLTAGLEFVSNEVQNLFEWDGGALSLISILPNGRPTSSEDDKAYVGTFSNVLLRHAMSTNGSRVVLFTELAGHGAPHLYLRDTSVGQTVQLDAPQGVGEPALASDPSFQDASSDDSRVLFLDASRLTPDATARQREPDLYECEVGVSGKALRCALRDLTADQVPGEAADVLGVIGADESGRYVYFVANGRLAPGAAAGDCPVSAGEGTDQQSCNLYVHNALTGSTRLVAVLSARDYRSWRPANEADLGGMTSRVAPDGGYLAFMSDRALTGFDNRDARSGEPDEEVYEYDLATSTLTCVSCAASGARPEGVLDPGGFPGLLVDRPGLWEGRWLAASIPGWTRTNSEYALSQSRYLSDSGRLFFNSATPLVPNDTNGLEDVYAYEPAGVGDCGSATGCVGMISSGSSGEESAFMDASADGSDVFFLTSAQLSASDTDNAYDLYDAHVCSSASPCASPAAVTPPPCSTADACRAASTPQPDVFGAPASQTYGGVGNPAPAAPAPAPPKPKPLTRAQKLANALKACRKDKRKQKRLACERTARKRYAPPKPAKGKKAASGSIR